MVFKEKYKALFGGMVSC